MKNTATYPSSLEDTNKSIDSFVTKGLSIEDTNNLIALFNKFKGQPNYSLFYGKIFVDIEVPTEKEKNVSGLILNVESQKERNNPYKFGLILDFITGRIVYGLVLRNNIIKADLLELSTLGIGLDPKITEIITKTNYGVLPKGSDVVIFERTLKDALTI